MKLEAFGLAITASSGPVHPTDGSHISAVQVDLRPGSTKGFKDAEQHLWYVSPSHAENGRPLLVAEKLDGGDYLRLTYADETEFVIDRCGFSVAGSWPNTLSYDDACVYLLGPVCGLVLRLRGVTCLHASAVVVAGRAVAIVGEGGAGKSTIAAAFAKAGVGVLTDDLAPLSERDSHFYIQPGLPRLLLWPDSTDGLFGAPDALPRIVETWEKLYLDLTQRGFSFSRNPLPLAAIYVLGDRRPSGVSITPLTGTEALIELVARTHVNYLHDSESRAAEFDVLSRLVQRVPVRRLHAPEGLSRLSELPDSICDDFHSLVA